MAEQLPRKKPISSIVGASIWLIVGAIATWQLGVLEPEIGTQ
jgi:hypothetical protein